MGTELLEDWLQRSAASAPSSRPSPPPFNPNSVQLLAQSWNHLRFCAQSDTISSDCLKSLCFLRNHGRSLHITGPQAKILLSILISSSSSEKKKAECTDEEKRREADIGGHSAVLLSIWIRRTSLVSSTSSSSSSLILESLLTALKSRSNISFFINEAILLLGAMCVVPHVKEDFRRDCQYMIVDICARNHRAIREGVLSYALSGIAYAMVSSKGSSLLALLQSCISLWKTDDGEIMDHMDPRITLEDSRISLESSRSLFKPSWLHDYLLLLHMMEWCGTMVISRFESPPPFHTLAEDIMRVGATHKTMSIKCAVAMSASGLLRCFHQRKHSLSSKNMELSYLSFVPMLESSITSLIDDTYQSHLLRAETNPLYEVQVESNPIMGLGDRYLLQCATLAVSRCTRFSPSVSVLLCLATTLLRDAFPLSDYYTGQITQDRTRRGLTEYVEGILFNESGTIFRSICEQYQSADKEWQLCVEKLFLDYSHFVYKSHRGFMAGTKNRDLGDSANHLENDNQALRKIHEAVLLSNVLLLSYASKQKGDANSHIKGKFGAEVLSSLACIEFIRQGLVPEYSDLVQTCVAWVSSSEVTCVMLKSLIPSLNDVVSSPGPLEGYKWTEDVIQDAHVTFGFRVLATCLDTFPVLSFLNDIAPTMFLYMKHPNQIIAQASHTLLVSFFCLSSGEKDNSLENQRNSVKEQVAVHFIERSFEEFPVAFHYDAFVSGVGALARQLPPGSSATMVCVSTIARKASELFNSGPSEDGADQNNESILEIAKKLQTLLLHIILVVDIQVLPHLLKEVARFVLRLQEPHRIRALEEAFDTLAGSDDLTRKHILVPWLQSLSFLCSNSQSKRTFKKSKSRSNNAAQRDGAILLNPSSSLVTEASRSRL